MDKVKICDFPNASEHLRIQQPNGAVGAQYVKNDWIPHRVNDVDIEKVLFTANADDSSFAM